jgi:hypothetical protein
MSRKIIHALITGVHIVKCRGSQSDVVYIGCPIAPSYMSPDAEGGGSCGVSANEYCPNKLWRSNSIFNLWFYVFTVQCFGFKRHLMFLFDFVNFFYRGIFWDFLNVCYSTLLHPCRPLDSTVSEEAGTEPRTFATLALTARRSNH